MLGANFCYATDDFNDLSDDDEDDHNSLNWRGMWRNNMTLFGQMTKVTTISETQSFLFKENR